MVALPLPDLPPELSELRNLALDLRWTWNHEADALWEEVDAEFWRRTRNPWSVLQNAPAQRLQRFKSNLVDINWLPLLLAAPEQGPDAIEYFVGAPAVICDAVQTSVGREKASRR